VKTTEEDVRVEARRVWPNAKVVLVRPGSPELIEFGPNAWRADAVDHHDREIAGVAAKSLEELKRKLEGMQPAGGQAP
jgi:hypothetical protein